MIKIRYQLKDARLKKGLIQAQVADIVGISERYYQHLEANTRKGSTDIWDKLEDLFGIPQRQLRESSQSQDNTTKK